MTVFRPAQQTKYREAFQQSVLAKYSKTGILNRKYSIRKCDYSVKSFYYKTFFGTGQTEKYVQKIG